MSMNSSANTGSVSAAAGTRMEPSIGHALPFFLSLGIFPLVAVAAVRGGWWIAGPFVFYWLIELLEAPFGLEERSLDPRKTLEKDLTGYKIALWLWAALWPATLVFSLWQMLVSGHLSVWEIWLMAFALTTVGQACFIVGHELVHRRALWERRLGDFLMSSVSYPQYATEHLYIHHALVCTPGDAGSAPKGQSFWVYIRREAVSSLLGAFRVAREQLARRRRAAWHYKNPYWRYFLLTAGWYALVYWMGGPWAVVVFAILGVCAILSLKIINYVQHYGLRRIRLPNGRYERIGAHHSWSAAYRLTNWVYYNIQRHADHHVAPNRRYPVLQHFKKDGSPQLPGNYMKLAGLALFPKRWFAAMDPLVDQWRAHFYPELKDWDAYDSAACAARPDAFEAISEIFAAAPRLAGWINRSPELLDNLKAREFTDLDLPGGFGPDPEFEAIARSGLTRVFWTLEFGVPEMREQIEDTPTQDIGEAVDAARKWSNDKAFQIGMHTLRGNLSPIEAGQALSNVAEAAMTFVLSAVEEEFAGLWSDGGFAFAVTGDLASREAAFGTPLKPVFVYEGEPAAHFRSLHEKLLAALAELARDNLLLAPMDAVSANAQCRSLADFAGLHAMAAPARELLELTRTRCIYSSGASGIAERFDQATRRILEQGAQREELTAALGSPPSSDTDSGSGTTERLRAGLRAVERAARSLQLEHPGEWDEDPAPGAIAVFRAAAGRGWLAKEAAQELQTAAQLLQTYRGMARLVAEEGIAPNEASPEARSALARACGGDDFDAMASRIREAASSAEAGVRALSA